MRPKGSTGPPARRQAGMVSSGAGAVIHLPPSCSAPVHASRHAAPEVTYSRRSMRTVSRPPRHSSAVPVCVNPPTRAASLMGLSCVCTSSREAKAFSMAMLGRSDPRGQRRDVESNPVGARFWPVSAAGPPGRRIGLQAPHPTAVPVVPLRIAMVTAAAAQDTDAKAAQLRARPTAHGVLHPASQARFHTGEAGHRALRSFDEPLNVLEGSSQ